MTGFVPESSLQGVAKDPVGRKEIGQSNWGNTPNHLGVIKEYILSKI